MYNIEQDSTSLTNILGYFISWNEEREEVANTEKLTGTVSAIYYIASHTYENIATLVRRFFVYACCILGRSVIENFVATLQYNQSSLEVFFSHIQHMDNDCTKLYAGGVQQHNSFHHLISKKKVDNTVYRQ